MRNSSQLISGMIISVVALAVMCTMVSCGSTGGGAGGTCVSLGRDGTVCSDIEESFEESYYDKEELQQTILAQAATYNRNAGEGSIKVEKVEEENGIVRVQMTYGSAKDYASFNWATFFTGTPQEAAEEGYELNVVLSGVKDPMETVGKADILAMENVTLLITNINDRIVLNGKALYVSENVTVSGNGKTISRAAQEKGLAYIIFK